MTPQYPSKLSIFTTAIESFQTLDQQTLAELESALDWVSLRANETLCEEGEEGDSMFVLVSGELGIRLKKTDTQELELNVLGPGSCVGEMALLSGQPRSATVYALEDVSLVRLSKEGFKQLADKYPEMITHFANVVLPRLRSIQLTRILTELFGEMEDEPLQNLIAKLEWLPFSRGELIIQQGDSGDAMFIVISGRVEVLLESEGSLSAIREIGPRETVGEFSLITEQLRSATVVAMRDSELVKLPKSDFDELMGRHPQAMLKIARIVVHRELSLMKNVSPYTSRAMTFAIVPLDAETPITEFAGKLGAGMTGHGKTLHLNSAKFDDLYGKKGASQSSLDHPLNILLAHWLAEKENSYQYILYETDPELTNWTKRCLAQADRVLLVARGNGSPEITPIENKLGLSSSQTRLELALVHVDSNEKPVNTGRWFKGRTLRAHHHVRWSSGRHFRRLGRRLADRGIAIVFSGGGARGFIHIGTIRALAELGIEVDVVGGTSMGALIGASYAMEMTPDEIYTLFKSFAARNSLLDFTFPAVSIVATRKIANLLQKMAGDIGIEDLWTAYYCVSANLSRSEPHVHKQGTLWEALRASMAAIPVFAPSLYQGDVHVDGAYMNNFPLDVMNEQYNCDLVIGINATPFEGIERKYDFGPSVSGWQVLWRKLNPFAKPINVPSIYTLIDYVGFLNSNYHKKKASAFADIMIAPQSISEFSSLDFEAYDKIIEIGYQEAMKHLRGVESPFRRA